MMSARECMDEYRRLKLLEDYRGLVKRIIEAFRDVPFPIIVEMATDTQVEPFDMSRDEDKVLVKELSKLADMVMFTFNTNPINKRRINEVSNFLERQIPLIFNQNRGHFRIIKTIKYLGRVGYPDGKIVDVYDRVIYLEIKATQRPDVGSPRDFYFTPLEETKRKITASGKHCLLGFIISGQPGNFRTIGWKLVDLSKIRVNLKPEFNADNRELYRRETILAENYIGQATMRGKP